LPVVPPQYTAYSGSVKMFTWHVLPSPDVAVDHSSGRSHEGPPSLPQALYRAAVTAKHTTIARGMDHTIAPIEAGRHHVPR
jgi:hypothetical protein